MSTLISISNSSTLIGAEPPDTIRAPEIEPGVGCDFDSYLLVPDNSLDERIASAKKRLGKDVVILGHHYQRDEVVKFADFSGDSLKLSYQAAEADARYIVFCGVHFMAESADILRRSHQIVVLPDLNAGCSMADMADIGQVETCWDELSSLGDLKVVPVTYMNSTAAIKAFTGEHGGSVCTSSNAAAVMRWAFERGEKVLFLPDEHLGRNTAFRMGNPLDQMESGVPAEMLVGQEQHLFSTLEGPAHHRCGIGTGAYGPAVLAGKRLDRRGRIHVRDRNNFQIAQGGKLIPARFHLTDIGHIRHRAAGVKIRQNHDLLGSAQNIRAFRHEVHTTENNVPGVGLGGLVGQL